jgi:hypothetical protein
LSSAEPETFLPGTFAHFAPIPDPLAQYRGMSWLTPIIRHVRSYSSAATFKEKFFANAATPNLLIKFPPTLPKEKAKEWIETFEQEHTGAFNAFRTAYLGAGADATPVGSKMSELDLKAVQGEDETIIAAAGRVHPVIVGLSEGMEGSSLNAGNYSTIKRQFGDGTIRPLWQNLSGSLQPILTVPGGAQLWYDDRHIPFLAEDLKDAAAVFSREAQAIRTLTDGGYKPPSVVNATASRDVRLLEHAGYLPVQVQPIQGGQVEDAEARPVLYAQISEPLLRPTLPTPGWQCAARETFWPVSGVASGLTVEQGMILPADHYLVRAFPQMFERAMVIEGTAVRIGAEVRCSCGKLLAEQASPPYRFTCPRCKEAVAAA